MADYYDHQGYYINSVVYPDTVGYPIDTSEMSAEEIEDLDLQPIEYNKYEDCQYEE